MVRCLKAELLENRTVPVPAAVGLVKEIVSVPVHSSSRSGRIRNTICDGEEECDGYYPPPPGHSL